MPRAAVAVDGLVAEVSPAWFPKLQGPSPTRALVSGVAQGFQKVVLYAPARDYGDV